MAQAGSSALHLPQISCRTRWTYVIPVEECKPRSALCYHLVRTAPSPPSCIQTLTQANSTWGNRLTIQKNRWAVFKLIHLAVQILPEITQGLCMRKYSMDKMLNAVLVNTLWCFCGCRGHNTKKFQMGQIPQPSPRKRSVSSSFVSLIDSWNCPNGTSEIHVWIIISRTHEENNTHAETFNCIQELGKI